MPRIAVEGNSQMFIRIRAEAADAVIKRMDHLQLSARDSLRVLDLLENPPAPNAKLMVAARVLP
jgi:uncharacterized protein (DUF1778 family)